MKVVKWLLYGVGVLVVLLLVVVSGVYFITEQHRNKTYDIAVESIEMEANEEVLTHGKHVATIRGCADCHGENLGGKIFIEDPIVGLLPADNLTTGEGGIGDEYSDEDMIRAIRHGVRKDGKSVVFMPSHEYNGIDSEDLGSLISYIRSVEPVDNVLPETRINIPFRMIYLFGGELHLFPARLIDHSKPIPEPVEDRTPMDMGQYLAVTCTGCHGADFKGGPIPGVPPSWPESTDITSEGTLVNWTAEQFKEVMCTGITPEGKEMNTQYMPWQTFGQMTDEELEGLYTYFSSLE
ncbi:MAG: c-type cytochrome [Bacteroidetes bacterium]|jgi:mono/diheme cytochrome c family protein|nr:c-type cytochrome [Bacteroidota bacterium]